MGAPAADDGLAQEITVLHIVSTIDEAHVEGAVVDSETVSTPRLSSSDRQHDGPGYGTCFGCYFVAVGS